MKKIFYIILCWVTVFIGLIDISKANDSSLYNICSLKNSIKDDDQYELYYVQAPLLYAKYGNLFEKINAYHSGISLYNKNCGPNISLDYYAIPSFENTLLPKSITNDSKGNYNLTWESHGIIEVTNFINKTYWNKRTLTMYNITGFQVKQYLSWVTTYNKTHPFYNLFSIESSSSSIPNDSNSGEPDYIIYKNSSTCDDFVWESFNIFYQLGADVPSIQSDPPSDKITLYANNEPKLVDYNNVTQRNKLASFYLELMDIANISKNKTALQIFEQLISIFNGSFYCYIDGEYYEIYLSKQTPISFTYLPSPIPSGKRDQVIIKNLDHCNSNDDNHHFLKT